MKRILRGVAVVATTTTILGLALAPAFAKGGGQTGGEAGDDKVGGTSTGLAGDYSVTLNGTTYNPALGKDVKLKNVAVSGQIVVTGVHTSFTFDPATDGVYNYTLTGAASPDRMVTSPTVLFASKVPTLTAAQLAHPVLSDLEIKDDTVTAIIATDGGKMKVQAKDAASGGIFQMEPEFGSAVTVTHVLGAGIFYFVNPFTGKVNFGNGIDAVTPAQSATGYHQMLLGKDSPQVATKLAQTGTTTVWSVTSGGRRGGVLGEDATEASLGASTCTQQCQAQERIQGSLPVPPNPTNPTPIGG
jgi:hypothetical protein